VQRTRLTSALAAVLTAGAMTAPRAWADTARTAGVQVVAHASAAAGTTGPPRTALAALALAVIGATASGLALAQLYASRAAR
jgi:hypothetical protein